MALTDWQKAEIKVAADKYLGKRNQEIAAHTDKLRVDYKIDGQSVYIFDQGSGNFPEQHHGNLSLWFSASSWPFIRRIVSGGEV